MNKWKGIILTSAMLFVMEQHAMAAQLESDTANARCFFAFTNVTGNRLISVLINGETIDPASQWLTWFDNQATPLNFVEKQRETADNILRHVSYNFDHLPGYLFELPQPLTDNISLFVTSREFMRDKWPITVRNIPIVQAAPKNVKRIEKMRGKITGSWMIARIGSESAMYIMKFAPRNDRIRASLVFVAPNKILFEDYNGDITRRGDECFRFGDTGPFRGLGFTILAAFGSPRGISIVRSWSAKRGDDLAYLTEAGTTLTTALNSYRYWPPLM